MLQRSAHPLEILHKVLLRMGFEVAMGGFSPAGLHRMVLCDPAREAAVQDEARIVAHRSQVPPRPGRRKQTLGVIGHHSGVGIYARAPHRDGKVGRSREHVGQRARAITQSIDIEAHSARDVSRAVLLVGVARRAGHDPAGVEDADLRVVQPLS